MKRGKKLAVWMAGAVLAAGLLSGCQKQQEPKTDEAQGQVQEGAQQAAGEDSKEQVTLRFSWWGGDSRHEATLACIEAFEKENPNIKIEAEYGGFDGYQDKMSASLSGQTEADIMQMDQPWMATFMAQNPDFFVNIRDYEDCNKCFEPAGK